MPNIKDYVQGYGEQNPGYDGPYLAGHDYDPSRENQTPVELDYDEELFGLDRQLYVAPEDNS